MNIDKARQRWLARGYGARDRILFKNKTCRLCGNALFVDYYNVRVFEERSCFIHYDIRCDDCINPVTQFIRKLKSVYDQAVGVISIISSRS